MRREEKEQTGDSGVWSVCEPGNTSFKRRWALSQPFSPDKTHSTKQGQRCSKVAPVHPNSTWLSWLRHGTTDNKLWFTFLHAQATFFQLSVSVGQNKRCIVWLQIMRERPAAKNRFEVTSGRKAQWHSVYIHWPHKMIMNCVQRGVIQCRIFKSIAWSWCVPGWILIDHINKEKRIKK